MRILLIGDMHIPEEAEEIPDEFLEEAESCDLIICTGDLTENMVLDELFERAKVRAVKGEKDYIDLPEQDLVTIEEMKFGVVHGHQIDEVIDSENEKMEDERDRSCEASEEEGKDSDGKGHAEKLMEFADLLKANVLVTGHTHKPFRTEKSGTVLLNPGSATGVGGGKRTCMVVEVEGTDLRECEILTA
ncbi:MAG: YfcE family phosphodiesterase [Candidatus Aenigmatarchaeota archaeon]